MQRTNKKSDQGAVKSGLNRPEDVIATALMQLYIQKSGNGVSGYYNPMSKHINKLAFMDPGFMSSGVFSSIYEATAESFEGAFGKVTGDGSATLSSPRIGSPPYKYTGAADGFCGPAVLNAAVYQCEEKVRCARAHI